MFLEGRVAIVTAGGGPGMGSAFCRALAGEGAAIVAADMDEGRASGIAQEISNGGGRALAVQMDVSKKAEVTAAVERAVQAFGTVSIMVNHAGNTPGGVIEELTEEAWDRTIAVHLKGTFLCSQAVLPYMKQQSWGRIVSTSSRAAYRPTAKGVFDYAAAKAGIIGFSKALAGHVGEWGITVNCIAPGHVGDSGMGLAEGRPRPSDEELSQRIATEGQLVEPKRFVEPTEIAGALLYFVGPYSARVTGTVAHVNGGSYLPA